MASMYSANSTPLVCGEIIMFSRGSKYNQAVYQQYTKIDM